MRSEFLPFSRPSINDDDINAVSDVLRSGWITTGSKCRDLELFFREFLGCEHAISLNSATAGMHLVLHSLGIGPGDEVITPAMTWVSTINLIVLAGARPVFADIDRDTLMVTPESVESVITSRTRLIIPVHFAGAPADLAPLRQISANYGIPLLEDAAHALGTEYREMKIGSQGTTIFSFHPIKNITTGEGGMICTNDHRLAQQLRRLRFHGLGVDSFDRQNQGRSPHSEVLEPGYKYNLTDMAAALGLSQIQRLGKFIEKRSRLAFQYREKLEGIPGVIPLAAPACPHKHAWHLFPVRLGEFEGFPIDRDLFMAELKKRNIGTGIHFRAVHRHRFYRELWKSAPPVLPHTEWNDDRLCTLPLFPDMTRHDVDDVILAIKQVLIGIRRKSTVSLNQ